MKNILLFALLLTACEKPTPTQVAADNFFKDAKNQLAINCRGKYDLDELSKTYKGLREAQPDSAIAWACRLYINASVGDCPK